MRYPPALSKLITLFKKFPGVGSKSAERFVFQMIDWDEELLKEMGATITHLKKELTFCPECSCMVEKTPCLFCNQEQRDSTTICVVSSFKDVFLLEEMGEYRGLYHVLGGVISPLQGKEVTPNTLLRLQRRIAKHNIEEVILALEPTLEGDATALYIKEALSEIEGLTLSRLALGIPMGSSLDYIDQGTLAFAFSGRGKY